jgi:hypothetical protein
MRPLRIIAASFVLFSHRRKSQHPLQELLSPPRRHPRAVRCAAPTTELAEPQGSLLVLERGRSRVRLPAELGEML